MTVVQLTLKVKDGNSFDSIWDAEHPILKYLEDSGASQLSEQRE